MTHAYAVRLPLRAESPVEPVDERRLAAMAAAGWSLSRPEASVDVATVGKAETLRTGDWVAVGMVFFTDRTALLRLLPHGVAGTGDSDLRLMLEARRSLGPDFAAQVSGAFSVAFLNAATGEWDAHRDGFGIYPLFHTVANGTVTFGSDLRACLHLSGRALSADSQRIADYVQGMEVDLDRTVFEGVSRLPPGHRLEAAPAGVTRTQVSRVELPSPDTQANAAARLRTALKEATDACMASGGTVGAMLSGGLDSSSLVALAAEGAETPLRTLSFVYGDKAYDETAFIEAANTAAGAQPHLMPVTSAPDLSAMGPLIEEQMDLFLAPGLQKSSRIYKEARELGLDALIDGHGGDEVISHGYGRLVELAARRRLVALWREARGAARIHGVPFMSVYAGHVAQYAGLRPRHPLRRVMMKLARRSGRKANMGGWPQGASPLFGPEQLSRFDAAERYRPKQELQDRDDFLQAERLTHLAAVTSPLMVHSFEVLHRTATAAGILPRYPFFDRRVVALCLALPAEVKLRDGRSRWVLREAMAGLMPDKIRLRPDKAEFGAEFRESLRGFFTGKGTEVFEPLAAHVDIDAAERLRADILSERLKDAHAARALWRLAVLLHWVKAFSQWQAAQAQGTLIR